ncbi:ATP-binding protein [Gemmobacter fulvus]|uniref:Oxygen sensor histidine kinase NreB n=1 Tax=Gemmobacter fulvus TaxID=2840474 RepID=A0A975P7K8_9RHOB|nr:ATP-binding protein [Gemmobacter fulvus]MBT9244457.1 ATP-binding protein [Gemmobacter fulvus]QWK91329.1 ATP-binding protein [Gemmobacter fulvus]
MRHWVSRHLPHRSRWTDWSLATQFAVAGGIVMLVAMLITGQWMAARIEQVVVRNWANATALYMESFISPLSQDLAASDDLSPLAHKALDEVFTSTALGARVKSYKIWKDGGLVVDASDHSLLGRRFAVDGDLARAWKGEVAASFADLHEAENAAEAALGVPLLEIYSPIREVWSGRIIGVVEFYELATGLEADLWEAKRRSWATVAAVLLAIGAVLWGIVLKGSRTIESQRAAMQRQLRDLSDLSRHNMALRLRVQGAAARSAEMHDQALRQVGADLHDGPAQLLGFAALRLDGLRPAVAAVRQAELTEVAGAVSDAIREIRAISRGVSLPDIAARNPCDIVAGLAEAHRARTGTEVAVTCDADSLPPLAAPVKTCLYRFVQEGLNNAWRHAQGQGQQVRLGTEAGALVLRVLDSGPGFAPAKAETGAEPDGGGSGLGLAGLRDRVEALGGSFETINRPEGGAEVRMVLTTVRG